MEIRFRDEYLGILAENKSTGKKKYPVEVEQAFKKRIFQIKNFNSSQDLRNIKSLHFEKLKEKRYLGQHSIRLTKSYRLIFEITKDGSLEVMEVDEINNHYG